jgi:hypothetical protein
MTDRDDRRKQQFIYDGQQLLGVIEQQADGRWRLIVRRRDAGTYATREAALAALHEREGEP